MLVTCGIVTDFKTVGWSYLTADGPGDEDASTVIPFLRVIETVARNPVLFRPRVERFHQLIGDAAGIHEQMMHVLLVSRFHVRLVLVENENQI